MRFPCFKPHWRTFYKILYTRCIFKMCQNFTYEVVGQRRRLKAFLKNRSSKNKCHFIFWHRIFLNIFSEFYIKSVGRG
jgi:hypothetical protein